jgi:flagellar hook-associated protein 2
MSIGGLPGLSGYDFSGIVEKLVDAYRLPETQMFRQQTKLESTKKAWLDVNTKLSALESKLKALQDSNTWKATKATSNNSSLLDVTTGSGSVPGLYNVIINQVAAAQNVVSSIQNVSSTTAATSVPTGNFNITVNGVVKAISVTSGDSLSTIASTINNSNAGVSASVVQVNGGFQLAISNLKTGTTNAATFSDDASGVLLSLGILDSNGILKDATSTSATGGKTLSAADAQITVNGISNITSSTNTVTSAIPGLTLNLKSADPSVTTTVTVTEDNSVAEKAVQDFIDQYNTFQSFISNKLNYDKDNKTAGDLFGDPMLQGIQSKLRAMMGGMFSNPSGTYDTLKEVGIATSSVDYGKDATLTFDTAKFKEALEADRQSVANLFGATYGGVTPLNDLNDKTLDPALHQGLGNYLQSYLTPLIKFQGVLSQTQENLGKQIDNVKDRISDFEDRVLVYQERMTKKFAALESILSNISAQGSWMMAQANALSSQQNSSK